MIRYTLALLLLALFSCEKQTQESSAEEEVRETTEAYVKALNQKNIQELLDFWAEEAVYRNPVTGNLVQGKANIKKEYFILFDEMKKSQLTMTVHSITFPFEDKAVEEGVLHLHIPGQNPIDHDYTMILVKREGKWKILNISEINIDLPESLKK